MKKMWIIICILTIVFISMISYRSIKINGKENISIEEITNIEKYIKQIYAWKEVTKEALPEFENIEKASEEWKYEVIKKNIGEVEISKETIENKGKELFGNEFTINEDKILINYFEHDKEKKLYYALPIELDSEFDTFIIDKIEDYGKYYSVRILEYLEDYGEEGKVKIRNTNEEEIGRVSEESSELEKKQIVKEHKNRFTSKELKIDKNQKIIKSVEKCEEY